MQGGKTHYAHLDDLYVISLCFISRFENKELANKNIRPRIAEVYLLINLRFISLGIQSPSENGNGT